ncbi:MAG: hypothetical protein IID41_03220 [Planctomycetes bacterium]|nr:hypothetical protein [Planctomycetota bacterium]
MNRSAAYAVLAFLLGGAVIFGPTFADEASPATSGKGLGEVELAKQLRAMLVAQTEAKQEENLAGTIENVDRRLAVKYATQFQQVFRTFKLEYSLDDFKLLYHDDEVAVTRVKLTVKKVEGPDFKDNQRDALQIFRKRDGQWKIFEQVILDRTFLDATPKPAPTTKPTESPFTQPKEKPDTKPGEED